MKANFGLAFTAALAGAAYAQEAPKPTTPEGELQQEVYASAPRGALAGAVESYTRIAGTYEGVQATGALKRLPGSVQEGFALAAKPGALLPIGLQARLYRSGEIGGEFGEGGRLYLDVPLDAGTTLLADGRAERNPADRLYEGALGLRTRAGTGTVTIKVGDAEFNGESFWRGWALYEGSAGKDRVLNVSAGVNEGVTPAGKPAEIYRGMVALWPKDLKDDRDALRLTFSRNPEAKSWDVGLFYAIDATTPPMPVFLADDRSNNGFEARANGNLPRTVAADPTEYFVRHLNEGDWRARVAVVTAKYAQTGEDRDMSAGGIVYPGPALGKDWGALDGLYGGGRIHATETAGQRELKFVGELGYTLELGGGAVLRCNVEKEEHGPAQAVLALEWKF